jgi:diguanylate cyclase (GGDEF)-like protein
MAVRSQSARLSAADPEQGAGADRRASARPKGDGGAPGPGATAGAVTARFAIPEDELTPRVCEAMAELLNEIAQLRSQRQRAQGRLDRLARLADRDPLAPVVNRRAFVRELTRAMSYARRYGTSGCLVYFDIDGLKAINDGFGHAAGDAVLVRVANVLVENLRDSDVVGRLGGDEFGVVLKRADAATAQEKAASLAAVVAGESLEWDGKEIALSVAYGCHPFVPDEDADRALADADRAMYADKRRGRRGPTGPLP